MAKKGGFSGFPGMGGQNIQQLMRQAQKMQADLEKAQEEVKLLEAEASAGGGMVTARVNGDKKLLSLTIQPQCVDPEDVEMLQDLVTAAVNEAMAQIDALSREKLEAVGGGMNIPGLL
ncbi:MAG: YbaB/EbfC family nucleoid-associated protein [Christensenellales bacterium]|jgi:DNA-binding YbaB/EbfC family protein